MECSIRQQLVNYYLEWWNDFITVKGFAEYHGMAFHRAMNTIEIGKAINNGRKRFTVGYRGKNHAR